MAEDCTVQPRQDAAWRPIRGSIEPSRVSSARNRQTGRTWVSNVRTVMSSHLFKRKKNMQKEREKRDQQGKKKSSALRLFLLCSHFPPQREIHCFHSVVFPERRSRSLLLSDVITRYSPTPRLSIHKQSKKSAQNRTVFTHCFGRLKFFVAYYFTPFSEDSAMGRTKRKREQKKRQEKSIEWRHHLLLLQQR